MVNLTNYELVLDYLFGQQPLYPRYRTEFALKRAIRPLRKDWSSHDFSCLQALCLQRYRQEKHQMMLYRETPEQKLS